MNLENQIEYEYKTLLQLKDSNRTPIPLYVDGSKEYLNYGVLVIKFLEGVPLNNAIIVQKFDEGLIFHCDLGSQYTSSDFSNNTSKYKIIQSFSKKGCPMIMPV